MKYSYQIERPCPMCGHDVEFDLMAVRPGNDTVTCPECQERLFIDVDADFDGGRWRDGTTLHSHPTPIGEKLAAAMQDQIAKLGLTSKD